MPNLPVLTTASKHEILEKVLDALEKKFYKPELLGAQWKDAVASHRLAIESAPTQAGTSCSLSAMK